MSLDLATYRDRLNAYKVSGTDGMISSMKKQISDTFYSNPSYEQVTINFEDRDVHIVQEGVRGLKLLTKPDEDIKSGEYVIWKDKAYLCTHRFPDDKVQTKGTIQYCNHYLKWIDKDTNELIIRPCIEDARTLYTTGIKDEEVIEIPNGMVGIMLPYGEISSKLDRGDRFVFNKTSYRVTFYDETNYEGLITLICQEIGLKYTDDKENEIAERWIEVNGTLVDRLPFLDGQEPPIAPEPIEPPEEGLFYSIEVIGRKWDDDNDYTLTSGTYQTYELHKFDDGLEVSGQFSFEIDKTITNVTLTQIDDNLCKITTGNVMGKFKVLLKATDIDTGDIALIQEIYIEGR